MGYRSPKPKYSPTDISGEASITLKQGDARIASNQWEVNSAVVDSWPSGFWKDEGLSEFASSNRDRVITNRFLGCPEVTRRQTEVKSGDAPTGQYRDWSELEKGKN